MNNLFISYARHKAYSSLAPYLYEATTDPAIKIKFVSFLLGQGFTHSNKRTGIFSDQYLRDGYIVDTRSSLIILVMQIINSRFVCVDNQFLLPVICSRQAQIFQKQLMLNVPQIQDFSLVDVLLNKQMISCVRIDLKSNPIDLDLIKKIIRYFGNRGVLPTRDFLLSIVANYVSGNCLLQNGAAALALSSINFCSAKLGVSSIDFQMRAALYSLQLPVSNKSNDILQQNVYEFYQKFNSNCLLSMKSMASVALELRSDPSLVCVSNSLNRIAAQAAFAAQDSVNFSEFIVAQEFILDEICFLLSLFIFYTESNYIQIAKKFLFDCLGLTINSSLLDIALTGSCMHAFNLQFKSAINYFAKHSEESTKIFIGANCYHEIPESWGISADCIVNRVVTMQDDCVTGIAKYNGQTVDILLLSPNYNVNQKVHGFGCLDMHAIINSQLQLRAKNSTVSQMIVLLDLSMSDLSDVQLELLFNVYTPQINSGKLAFMIAYSLNKYFQVGFDRTAAGLSACLLAKQHFPQLQVPSGLLGFKCSDTSPQLITHMLKCNADNIQYYYNMIHGLSRYIHDQLIPDRLYNPNNLICIDCPYTNDIYRNPWGFVVLRFADINIYNRYQPALTSLLEMIGIKFRDGFGFNETTYIIIEQAEPPIYRISIGPDARAAQFLQLVDFIQEVNDTVLVLQSGQSSTVRPVF